MKSSDELILESIKDSFKSCSEIAIETGLTSHRVSIRMNKLLDFGLVYQIQGQSTTFGVKPKKYKAR